MGEDKRVIVGEVNGIDAGMAPDSMRVWQRVTDYGW
jgi:hypothetical protein